MMAWHIKGKQLVTVFCTGQEKGTRLFLCRKDCLERSCWLFHRLCSSFQSLCLGLASCFVANCWNSIASFALSQMDLLLLLQNSKFILVNRTVREKKRLYTYICYNLVKHLKINIGWHFVLVIVSLYLNNIYILKLIFSHYWLSLNRNLLIFLQSMIKRS